MVRTIFFPVDTDIQVDVPAEYVSKKLELIFF